MKKLALILILLLFIIQVNAHPGRTNAEGCHTCRTNCEQYGLEYGEYHCHNKTSSNDSTTSSSTTSSAKTSISTTSKKITTSIKKQEVKTTTTVLEGLTGSAIKEEDIKLVSTIENKIVKDIYPKEVENQLTYESSDYKARRSALYLFSFILVLVLIKFMVKK